MKQCVQTDIVFLIMELLTGEEDRTIEAAKHLVAASDRIDPELLCKILIDPGYKAWSKRMAAYVLGFVPADASSKHLVVLRGVLADQTIVASLRDHAAEALGNLHDEAATHLLSERLADEHESKLVRKSCIYALSQLRSSAATSALKRFALTQPHGSLAQELASAGLVPA